MCDISHIKNKNGLNVYHSSKIDTCCDNDGYGV